VALIRGNNTAAWYKSDGSGGFVRPFGTFSDLSYDSQNNQYIVQHKDGGKAVFNSSGLLVQRVDRLGRTTSYAYDNNGLLTRITEPCGRETNYQYQDGRLHKVTLPDGRTFTFEYAEKTIPRDQGDDLQTYVVSRVTETDPDGPEGEQAARVTDFGYSYDQTNHTWLMTSITRHPAGENGGLPDYQIEYAYADRVSKVINPDGTEWIISPASVKGLPDSPSGNSETDPAPLLGSVADIKATYTDELGRTTTLVPDRFGYVVSRTDPEGHTVVTERNAHGLVTKLIEPDPDGSGPLSEAVTTYEYDSQGNLIRLTHPEGTVESWTYESKFNRVVSYRDTEGHTTQYEYDDTNGNLLSAIDPLGNVTSYDYTDCGLVNSITRPDPDGDGPLEAAVTRYAYYPDTNLLRQVTNPDDSTRSFAYDALRRRVAVTDELGRTSWYVYDALGRVTHTIDPMGNVSQTNYDLDSRVTQQIAPYPTLTQGLRGYWSFLEPANSPFVPDTWPGQTADLSGNGHAGTLNGNPARIQGRMGSALQFDGQDDFVDLGDPAGLEIQDQITLSAWIKIDNMAHTTGFRNIIAHGYTRRPPGEVFLRMHDGYYEVGTWNGEDHLARAAIDDNDIGRWVHLTGTYDGQQWRLYRDGVEFTGTDVEHLGTQIAPVSVASDWAIGSRGTDEQT